MNDVVAPTLVAARTALPPEGALRLRPGQAGSAAPAGLKNPHACHFILPFVLSLSKDARRWGRTVGSGQVFTAL